MTRSVTVLELRDGNYREAVVVSGDERYEAARPFPVSLVPGELLR